MSAADLHIPPAGIDPYQPQRHRVVSRRRESHDTVTIGLVPVALVPAGGELERVRPGQFNMVSAFGVGEIPISVSGVNSRRGTLLHTIRAVGAVSTALTQARKGDVLGVRGPFGTPWDVEAADEADLVVVAGGLGLAPLRLAAIEAIAARRLGRVFVLVGARSPQDLLFARDLERWARQPGVEVNVTVDHAGPEWTGHVGLVTDLVRRAQFDPARALALVCGPEVMMRFTARALAERGVATGRIRLSLERNMKCGIGLCGHCQLGPLLLCRDGPVVSAERVGHLLGVREL